MFDQPSTIPTFRQWHSEVNYSLKEMVNDNDIVNLVIRDSISSW